MEKVWVYENGQFRDGRESVKWYSPEVEMDWGEYLEYNGYMQSASMALGDVDIHGTCHGTSVEVFCADPTKKVASFPYLVEVVIDQFTGAPSELILTDFPGLLGLLKELEPVYRYGEREWERDERTKPLRVNITK